MNSSPTQQVWRLCRHSLPPYGERVLLCWDGKGSSTWTTVAVGSRSGTSKKGEHWANDEEDPLDDHVTVFAWMPLPEKPNER